MSRVESKITINPKIEYSVRLPCDAKDFAELLIFMDKKLAEVYGEKSPSATYDDRFTVTSDGETLTISADLPPDYKERLVSGYKEKLSS